MPRCKYKTVPRIYKNRSGQYRDNVIIGVISTVTKSIPDNTVAAGSPTRIICSIDQYLDKNRKAMKTAPR